MGQSPEADQLFLNVVKEGLERQEGEILIGADETSNDGFVPRFERRSLRSGSITAGTF